MSAKKATTEKIRYADAMAELEEILEQLEGDDIDVDALASQVKRASELIKLCRERLGKTKLEIEQVVADLEELDDEPGEDGDPA